MTMQAARAVQARLALPSLQASRACQHVQVLSPSATRQGLGSLAWLQAAPAATIIKLMGKGSG
jgi:hypothetical protein